MNTDEDLFNGIPEDRHDETCPNDCHDYFVGIKGHDTRKVGDRFFQSLWRCHRCGELVVQLDEIETEDCPLCGCPQAFKFSEIEEVKKRLKD